MGRKRRFAAHAREKAVAEEVAEAVEMEQKEAVRGSKPDEELFIIDTSGSKRRRRKLEKEASEKIVSRVEKRIINKYLGSKVASKPPQAKRTPLSDPWADDDEDQATIADVKGQADTGAQPLSLISKSPSSKPLEFLVSEGGEAAGTPSGNTTSSRPVAEGSASSEVVKGTTGDSGVAVGGVEGDDFLVIPPKPGRPVKRPKPSAKDLAKLGICHPGQSYNPTPDDHDDVLASAVAVELRRQEAIDEDAAPVSAGMSKETLAVIMGDEEDEGSSDDDGEGGVGASLGRPTPATGKLTRAQRNKQKRARAAELELQRRRKKKEMLKTIDKISTVQKEVAEEERLREERRRTKRLLKKQKARQMKEGMVGGIFGPSVDLATMASGWQSNKNIIEGRSIPVNLSEELHGSLRQLKAQGSVLDDKVELLKVNKAHPDKKRAKERVKRASRGFRKKIKFKTR